jgi:nucleoid-associated protein EbfC
MFDNMKMMGALAGLMKNKDKLREAGQRIKDKAEATRVEGESGMGAVRVTVNGSMKVLDVELTPGLVIGMNADAKTRELAGALIADAVNDGISKAQAKMKEAIDEEARALGFEGGVPGLSGLLGA